ncbi:hypothetical protein [Actinoplanes sp. DH11]|uniref:hypothetical protein n=1 Tax=Actinoplanes sp. DH11 TaxID=2857011 RepID=UPI001E51D9DC|nr:hypothetical protein [Actinoplanes sp. DH11]
MSYVAQPPSPASPPQNQYPAPPRPAARPASITVAVALLWTMAVAGLAYAVSMVAVTPGTVGRFRDATAGSELAENFIAVVWLVSAVGAVVAVLVVALFVVLGLGLRRGSRVAWGVTLGLCVLGVLGGCGAVAAIGAQQSGDAVPGSLGFALNDAYPGGWIGLNAVVAVAQVIAYILVAFLLLLTPRAFFGGAAAARSAEGNSWGTAGAAPWHPTSGTPAGVPGALGHPGGPAASGGPWATGGPAASGGPWAAGGPGSAGAMWNQGDGGNGPVYPSSESPVTSSPWAGPHSPDQYPRSDQSPSEGDHKSVMEKPAPRPEDEYWSRPSD